MLNWHHEYFYLPKTPKPQNPIVNNYGQVMSICEVIVFTLDLESLYWRELSLLPSLADRPPYLYLSDSKLTFFF